MPMPPPYNQNLGMPIAQNGFVNPIPFLPVQEGRFPNPAPPYDPTCPAATMVNSTGGVGCEPGYNYYFPGEHTKFHIVKSNIAPWTMPAGMELKFGAYHVPCNLTLADVLQGFGARNPERKKNKLTEMMVGHSGKWYKGITIAGDNEKMMDLTLKEMGWDSTRTGRPGEKPVVNLWITKD